MLGLEECTCLPHLNNGNHHALPLLCVLRGLDLISYHMKGSDLQTKQMANPHVPVGTGALAGSSLWQHMSVPLCTDMRRILEDQH